ASMPRCETCQSLATPSSALYWHIGEMTMRLSSARSASRIGENSAEAMGMRAFWGGKRGARRMIGNGLAYSQALSLLFEHDLFRNPATTPGSSPRASFSGSCRKPHDGERQRLGARDDRVDLEILLGRMGAAADRADAADGRGADARGEA